MILFVVASRLQIDSIDQCAALACYVIGLWLKMTCVGLGLIHGRAKKYPEGLPAQPNRLDSDIYKGWRCLEFAVATIALLATKRET